MEHRIDPWLILAGVAILGASLVQLAALDRTLGGHLFLRQLVWSVVGLVLLLVLSRFSGTILQRLAIPAYGLSLVLLAGVLAAGQVRSGTRGWFALGPVTLQPSEVSRLGVALIVALWFGRRSGRLLKLGELAVLSILVGLPFLLVLLEPDLGVALTYFPMWAAAAWLGGLPPKVWTALALSALVLAGGAWELALKDYQKERVLTVLDPSRDPFGAGYQVRQSKIAIGSGLLTGQGLGRGTQSLLRYLPAQHTDFIFASWAEATGFLGVSFLILAYALLLWRITLAAIRAPNRFGLALTTMIGAWLAFQIVVNLGMVVGWLPTTGITLPLFSYGGSSLATTCAALGMVIAIGRERLVNL
ncbi:MAG: rod shape-determining protein RodA [Acidobacteria bacterium]|nr:rod shape-determining protein RodA [Acidobacteriota bacterium]